MAHILFPDAPDSGLRTMRRAVELGHRATFLRGRSFQLYTPSPWIRQVLDQVRVIDLPVTSDADLLADVMGKVHAEDPIDAVVGQLEPAMEATAIACERLGLPFTSRVGVLNARDKGRCREVLAAAGLATVKHATVNSVAEGLAAAATIGYPVVVKPVSGMGSLLAGRADDDGQLTRLVSSIVDGEQRPEQIRTQFGRGALIEEYLSGELVSAEIGMLDDRCHRFVVCGRSRAVQNECVEMGAAIPADLPARLERECFDYAERVCRALRLDLGVFHIELMLTARGPVLVEVNPRAMGGVMTTMYGQLAGVDFADYVIDIYLRKPPAVKPPRLRGTITARMLMPQVRAKLPREIPLSWVDSVPDIVSFFNYHIEPGAEVLPQQVLARYVVRGDQWTATMDRADELVARFERSLGIPLMHSIATTSSCGADIVEVD